ncbi:MAG: hypothetical protein OXR66_01440 [Candidatus Woesearchaeota archaeon]|nr:hypothetical protein [Candidatus Woesearchaeota archaeon]
MQLVRRWWTVIADPVHAFKQLESRSFEDVLYEYLKLLVLVSIAAGLFLFLLSMGKALYFDLFRAIDIKYWRLVNYASGALTATALLYLFSGTFVLFLISLLVQPFTRLRYTRTLQVLFYALTPLLLFGWFIPIVGGIALWSLALFCIGTNVVRAHQRTRKGTIRER